MVPMFLFTVLACLQWYIPPWDVADRMAFGLAMLLTVIAFKFSNAALLPAISYRIRPQRLKRKRAGDPKLLHAPHCLLTQPRAPPPLGGSHASRLVCDARHILVRHAHL